MRLKAKRKSRYDACACFWGNSLSVPVYVCRVHASCMFMWGVSGLSSQPSLMPLHPGRRLDGITGNWIVFHLLWKQPGRDTPSPLHPTTLPQYLQSAPVAFYPPLSGAPLFPSHYGGMSHRTPAFTCHPKFPLAVQKCWAGCQQSAQ